MGRLLKILLILVAGLVGIVVVAAISLALFFDPNDFRDRIQTAVKEQTGRDLTVGEIDLSLFPWLAVNVGPSQLGNPTGFRNDDFLSFDSAALSVRIMPLILRQEVQVGTAALDGLAVNLEVDPNGRNNWDDLAEGGESDITDEPTSGGAGGAGEFDVANVALTGASIIYTDAATGAGYGITGLTFETGRIAAGIPIDMRGEFEFESRADNIGGRLAMRNTTTLSEDLATITVDGLNLAGNLVGIVSRPADFNFDARSITLDTSAGTIDAGELDFTILGVSMAADVEPFSYAATPQPKAALRVATFSLKELMRTLDIEPPETVDPDAMQRVSFSANAEVRENDIQLTSVALDLDDSTMSGSLSLPMTAAGMLGFDLEVDAITLDGYMAPAADGAGGSDDGGDMEIPADLVRALNVDGSFRIREAMLAGMEFSNMQVTVKAADGKLRLHPLGADFYDGSYAGDVQIDASTDTPVISANERISGVNIGAMLKAMYDVDNVTGTINGQFRLQGAGKTMSAIQQDLDGTMSFELADGALEGTDVWHQLRSARATYRREPAPEPTLPPRTEFTSVRATGLVTDGIFTNDDFVAELPFLQLNGGGMVDLNTREVDYAVQVRVLDRPEFMAGATEAELADFTETVVPLKITGALPSPSIRPDIEGIFRARVEEAIEEQKEELRDRLLDRLLGGQEEPPPEGDPNAESEQEAEEDPEERLKRDLLKKLFEN